MLADLGSLGLLSSVVSVSPVWVCSGVEAAEGERHMLPQGHSWSLLMMSLFSPSSFWYRSEPSVASPGSPPASPLHSGLRHSNRKYLAALKQTKPFYCDMTLWILFFFYIKSSPLLHSHWPGCDDGHGRCHHLGCKRLIVQRLWGTQHVVGTAAAWHPCLWKHCSLPHLRSWGSGLVRRCCFCFLVGLCWDIAWLRESRAGMGEPIIT